MIQAELCEVSEARRALSKGVENNGVNNSQIVCVKALQEISVCPDRGGDIFLLELTVLYRIFQLRGAIPRSTPVGQRVKYFYEEELL